MIISRGTTPTFEFKFPELITNYDAILISFSQNDELILDKTKDDLVFIKDTIYAIPLLEEEINSFVSGIFECQVRISKNDEVFCSRIYRGRIEDVLNDEILGE